MEKISIIVPVYKVEKFLDRCVESIKNQTYKNLEIILVDDGSPDNSPKMCDDWSKKDERIKVIHKKNGGLSDARNLGIDQSSGDFLMFVDSDDYLDKTTCEKLYNLLKTNNADFVMCSCLKFYENEEYEQKTHEIKVNCYSGEDVINELYKMDIPYLMIACAKLYKRQIFETLRYPIGRLHEDEFVIHEILTNIKSFVYTNEQLYFYLQRQSSIMGSKKEKNITDTLCAFRQRYDCLNRKHPQNKDKTNSWYMKFLRVTYVCNPWITKRIKKEILKEYKGIYKNSKQRTIKDKIFYLIPRSSSFIMRLIKDK